MLVSSVVIHTELGASADIPTDPTPLCDGTTSNSSGTNTTPAAGSITFAGNFLTHYESGARVAMYNNGGERSFTNAGSGGANGGTPVCAVRSVGGVPQAEWMYCTDEALYACNNRPEMETVPENPKITDAVQRQMAIVLAEAKLAEPTSTSRSRAMVQTQIWCLSEGLFSAGQVNTPAKNYFNGYLSAADDLSDADATCNPPPAMPDPLSLSLTGPTALLPEGATAEFTLTTNVVGMIDLAPSSGTVTLCPADTSGASLSGNTITTTSPGDVLVCVDGSTMRTTTLDATSDQATVESLGWYWNGDNNCQHFVDFSTGLVELRATDDAQIDIPFYSLGNRLWFDTGAGTDYGNGVLDAGESLVSGADVELLDGTGAAIDPDGSGPLTRTATTTDAEGYYRFDNLDAGSYRVSVAAGNFATGAPLDGYLSSTGQTTSFVVTDNNLDHGDDPADPSASGVTSEAVTLGTTNPLADVESSATGAGANGPTGDSGDNLTVDFGFVLPNYSVGNVLWFDTGAGADFGNGTRDAGEDPVVSAEVELLDGTGSAIDPDGAGPLTGTFATTDANGFYRFDGLGTGSYVVVVTATNFATGGVLDGYASTTGQAVTFDSTDNNIDHGSDTTDPTTAGVPSAVVTITSSNPTGDVDAGTTGSGANGPNGDASDNLTVDFGFVTTLVSVGDHTWYDNDADGTQSTGDTPAAGITVTLYASGTPVATTTTDTTGFYSFTDLPPSTNFTIGFGPATGYEFTAALVGTDTTIDSNPNPTTGITPTFTTPATGNNSATTPDLPTIDAGYVVTVTTTSTTIAVTTTTTTPVTTTSIPVTTTTTTPVTTTTTTPVTTTTPAATTTVPGATTTTPAATTTVPAATTTIPTATTTVPGTTPSTSPPATTTTTAPPATTTTTAPPATPTTTTPETTTTTAPPATTTTTAAPVTTTTVPEPEITLDIRAPQPTATATSTTTSTSAPATTTSTTPTPATIPVSVTITAPPLTPTVAPPATAPAPAALPATIGSVVEVGGATERNADGDSLAFTGGQLGWMLSIALMLTGLGGRAILAARRRA